jgi:hypothetical protein
MPRKIDFAEFEQEVGTVLSAEQREWLARVLHDYVSGPVSTIVMHVELIDRMLEREADIRDEFASLKKNVGAAAKQVAAIEASLRTPN